MPPITMAGTSPLSNCRTSPSRAAKTSVTRSTSSTARHSSAAAEASSSQCASSATASTGECSAASANRLSAARKTRNRSVLPLLPQRKPPAARSIAAPGADQRASISVEAGGAARRRPVGTPLDALGPQDLHAFAARDRIIQECGLADPRLPRRTSALPRPAHASSVSFARAARSTSRPCSTRAA